MGAPTDMSPWLCLSKSPWELGYQPQSFSPARDGTPTPLTPSLCTPQVGFIEGDGSRTGVFPASFVHLLQD